MNAVIYARYSSYNQTERSIEGQIEDCMEYARRKGYIVIGQYVDRAKSGTAVEHRGDFLRMVKDSGKKLFDVVLVWKMDRFSRNRYDFAVYKSALRKNNVVVESVNEPTSNDPSGILLDSLIEGMAEYYSSNLSQNVRRGLRVARSRGTFTGGKLPFGYAVTNDKKIIPDETEAPILADCFRKYAAGEKMKDIVADLNARGIKPRTGKEFTINSLQHALCNRKYIGIYEYDGELYTDMYPRLIDDETFNAVQARRYAVRRAPAASKGDYRYLLQGKAFCGLCGAPMVGESGHSKSDAVYHYYACAEKKKNHTCKKHNERAEDLETDVVTQTVAYLSDPDRLQKVAEGLRMAYEDAFSQSEVQTLENTVNRLKREIDACMDIMISGSVSAATVKALDEKATTLRAQLDDAYVDLNAVKMRTRRSYTIDDYVVLLKDMIEGDTSDPVFRQHIINIFVNAVYVYDDKLLLYYNVEDQPPVPFSDTKEDGNDLSKNSDFTCNAQPKDIKSEFILIIKSDLIYGFNAFKIKSALKKGSP